MTSKKKNNWQDKIDDLENKWKRALADYANLEKRIAKEKDFLVKFSNQELLEKLLPVLDDLERAEKHLKDQGLTIAINKLREVLKNEGIIEIKAEGEEFDPRLMEAIEAVEGPKNRVMEVVNKGYRWGDKILRVAKVKVGGKQDNKETKS
jgi:molecular chaperone GrpE